MNTLILFFKGLVIGLGKIIPGVSGSLMAISLGVYEDALKAICYFWKEKKESFLFLLPLGVGILISILFGSKILLNLLQKNYVYTVTVFLGLIVGTIPSILQKQEIKRLDWGLLGLILFLFFLFHNFISFPEFVSNHDWNSWLYIFFLGFIDAFTTVVPGISGTATFMMLGSYTFVLELFSNPFGHLWESFLFGSGLLLGIFLMVKIISYCFLKYKHLTWISILGFLVTSLFSLFLKMIDFITLKNLFPLLLLFLIGYNVIRMFDLKEK